MDTVVNDDEIDQDEICDEETDFFDNEPSKVETAEVSRN